MHETYLRALDPPGLHWLLACHRCDWRVVIDDSGIDNDHNYVALADQHNRTKNGQEEPR